MKRTTCSVICFNERMQVQRVEKAKRKRRKKEQKLLLLQKQWKFTRTITKWLLVSRLKRTVRRVQARGDPPVRAEDRAEGNQIEMAQ